VKSEKRKVKSFVLSLTDFLFFV